MGIIHIINKNTTKMKKLFLIAAMMVMTLAANAQLKVGTTFVKPTVGINLANISGQDQDMRVGAHVGAEFEHALAKQFSVSGGLIYSMQGMKTSGGGVTVTTAFDYINIPIMGNYYISKNFALKFGLQPGFKASAKSKISGNGSSGSEDWDSSVSQICLSIPLGFAVEFSDFVLDARYSLGITNVLKDDYVFQTSGKNGKNNVISINLAYKLPL